VRRLKNTLLVLFTLLLVAAGAAMPGVTTYVQDSYGAGMQEDRSFDSFSLTLRQDSEAARILRYIASGNYWMEEAVNWIEESENLAYTPQQAGEAAVDVLERMAKCGVMDASVLENIGTPQITLSTLRTDASLFALGDDISGPAASLGENPEEGVELITFAWDCWWPEVEDGFSPMVRIDDTTGKILLAMVPTPWQKYGIDFAEQEKGWELFLADHYGFEVVGISRQYYDGGDARLTFQLDPEDGEGQLPVVVDINPLDGGYYSYVSPYAH